MHPLIALVTSCSLLQHDQVLGKTKERIHAAGHLEVRDYASELLQNRLRAKVRLYSNARVHAKIKSAAKLNEDTIQILKKWKLKQNQTYA